MNAFVRATTVAAALMISCPALSIATSLAAVEVAQPFATEGGLMVSAVTYLKFLGSRSPGEAVPLVGEPSWVTNYAGNPVSANEAARAGIKTGCDPKHLNGGLYGDTLSVWIDLSAARDTMPDDTPLHAIIAATVECVLITAYKGRMGSDLQNATPVEAHWIRLEVRGAPQYASMGGVFATADLGTLPRKRY